MCCKSGLIRQPPAPAIFESKPGYQAWGVPLLLLLHGSNLDDILVIGVGGYLVVMFVLAQLKTRRLRREKLRRKAERAAARAQAEAAASTEEKIRPNLEN
jgi:hypothetical protein